MQWYVYLIIAIVAILLLFLLVTYTYWRKAMVTPSPKKFDDGNTVDKIDSDIKQDQRRITSQLQQLHGLEEVWIKSKDGLNLHGYYRESREGTERTIICVHGWHSDSLSSAATYSHFLVEYNYNILFVDLRSYGKSEGKYTTYGVKDSEDLIEWINYLIDRTEGNVSIGLFGVSMGGTTVCNVADRVPKQVKCIIDDCGFTNAKDQLYSTMKQKMKNPKFLINVMEIWNKMILHFDYHTVDSRKALQNSKVPVLFIHGAQDDFVPAIQGIKNYEACTTEKDMKIFDNAKHARCYLMNKEIYKNLILNFLVKKL